jgi:carboxylate-amine ligase
LGTGVLDDYTRIWWDVRPHPRLGTVEENSLEEPANLFLVANPDGTGASP